MLDLAPGHAVYGSFQKHPNRKAVSIMRNYDTPDESHTGLGHDLDLSTIPVQS